LCCDHDGVFRGKTTIIQDGVRRTLDFHGRYAPGLRRGGGYFMIPEVPAPPFSLSNGPISIGYMDVLPSR
jgi:hypothetical protein